MAKMDSMIKRIENCMRYDTGVTEHTARITQISWILFLRIYDAMEQQWEFCDENYKSIIPEEYKWRNWAHDDKTGKALTGDELLDFVNKKLIPTLGSLSIDSETLPKQAIVVQAFENLRNLMTNGIELRKVLNIVDEIDFNRSDDKHHFNEIYENLIEKMRSQKSSGEYYTPRAVTNFIVEMVDPKLGEQMADFACGTGGFLSSTLNHLEKQIQTTDDQRRYGSSVYGVELMPMPYIMCLTNMVLHNIDNPRVYHSDSLSKNVNDYSKEDKFDVILMNPPFGGTVRAGCKENFPTDLQSAESSELFLILMMYRLKKGGRAAVIMPPGFLLGTDGALKNIKEKLMREFNLHTIIRLPYDVFQPYTATQTNILFFDSTGPTKQTWIYRMDKPEGYKHFSKTKPIKMEHFKPVIDWWFDRKEITIDDKDKAKCYSFEEIEKSGYYLDLCGFPQEDEDTSPPCEVITKYQDQRNVLTSKIDNLINEIQSVLDNNECNHKRDTSLIDELCNLNSSLISLESSWNNKIKTSILQFAVQGKLVPQYDVDESVQIKGAKPILKRENSYYDLIDGKETCIDDQIPFIIPDSWNYYRFGDIVSFHLGKTPSRSNSKYWKNGTIPWISISDMTDNSIVTTTKECITDTAYTECFSTNCKKGSLLMSFKLSIGKVSIAGMDCVHNEAIISINPKEGIDQNWLMLILPIISKKIKAVNAVKGETLNKKTLSNMLIPIPPLAEQMRIVDKMNGLYTVLPEI